jgi:hypothetical protein
MTIEKIEDVIQRVIIAWDEMQKYGNHDGDCDNEEICLSCGNSINSCMKHVDTMNIRQKEMNAAIVALAAIKKIP